jgi:hypothetical protein
MKVVSFCLAACLLFVLPCSGQDIEGTWQTLVQGSSLQAHAKPLRYVVHISKMNQTIAGTMGFDRF